jgi:hypothetical protein
MSKRLQVVMSDEDYRALQRDAAAHRVTVSAWVRRCLWEGRGAAGPELPGVAPLSSRHVAEPSRGPSPDRELLEQVMERHGLASPDEALELALRRAAAPTPRTDLLGLGGAGWRGLD